MSYYRLGLFEKMLRIIASLAAALWCALIFFDTRHVPGISSEVSRADMQGSMFALAEKTADKYSIAGGFVGLIDGENLYGKPIGFADIDNARPVTGETAFNIGSVSKPISAWGVLALAQDGHIDLDTPVGQYLDQWVLPHSKYDLDQITVRRLLWHTAGINIHGYAGYESLDEPIRQPFRPVKYAPNSLAEASRTNYPLQVIREPGTARVYSGGGYAILQMLIEDISGMPFADYMRERILVPLEMSNSDFTPDRVATKANAYNIRGDRLPDMQFLALAPAGLYTSGNDLGAFLLAQMSDRETALSSANIATMLAPTEINNAYAISYTRQSFEEGFLYGHGGNNSSWHAQVYFVPQTRQGFYFLTNSTTGAQWEIDLSCSWKSWALGQKVETVCGDSLQIVRRISASAAIIGVIAILIFARVHYRLQRRGAHLALLPRAKGLFAGFIQYFQITLMLIFITTTAIVFFTDFIYWRQGVSFFDEIPIYEVRYLIIAIIAFQLASLLNIWLTTHQR